MGRWYLHQGHYTDNLIITIMLMIIMVINNPPNRSASAWVKKSPLGLTLASLQCSFFRVDHLITSVCMGSTTLFTQHLGWRSWYKASKSWYCEPISQSLTSPGSKSPALVKGGWGQSVQTPWAVLSSWLLTIVQMSKHLEQHFPLRDDCQQYSTIVHLGFCELPHLWSPARNM